MLLSMKYSFVVLFTPKCASNSIESMLLPYSDMSLIGPPYFRHTNFRRYSEYIEPFVKKVARNGELETICLVREPLSWLNSHYRFRTRLKIRNPNHPKFITSTANIDFDEYVAAYMQTDPPTYANVGSQFDFVRDKSGGVGVDTLFAYEEIGDFVAYMSQKVGKRLRLDLKNVSPTKRRESAFTEFASLVGRKLFAPISSKSSARARNVDHSLPDHLLASLKEHMKDDFDLYDSIQETH